MSVALKSDIGLTCGFIISVHSSADMLLSPDDKVLKRTEIITYFMIKER